jgi:hypothetical protein
MDFFNNYMLETCNVAVAGLLWYLKHCWFLVDEETISHLDPNQNE